MSRFSDNAARIFEAVESACRSGHVLSEMTILIGASGGIRMIADSDWPLASLCAHHGAQMGFRVSEQKSRVRVEGQAAGQTCVMQADKPGQFARMLASSGMSYELMSGSLSLPAGPAPLRVPAG